MPATGVCGAPVAAMDVELLGALERDLRAWASGTPSRFAVDGLDPPRHDSVELDRGDLAGAQLLRRGSDPVRSQSSVTRPSPRSAAPGTGRPRRRARSRGRPRLADAGLRHVLPEHVGRAGSAHAVGRHVVGGDLAHLGGVLEDQPELRPQLRLLLVGQVQARELRDVLDVDLYRHGGSLAGRVVEEGLCGLRPHVQQVVVPQPLQQFAPAGVGGEGRRDELARLVDPPLSAPRPIAAQ